MEAENIFIYGKHAVLEAVSKKPEVVERVYVREDLAKDEIVKASLDKVSRVTVFDRKNLPQKIDKEATHQGLVAEIKLRSLLISFKDFKETLSVSDNLGLVVLGEVQDPHNVGAIIRSAAAFGVGAVLIPEHRSCPVTATVIKVSAGTAFSVPLVSVKNVNSALQDLKKMGFWVYGLDGDGKTYLHEEAFTKPSVFVVGNEASGMRLKTHEKCDTILNIPIDDKAESLNASVAAAVTLYAWSVFKK